MDKISFIFLVIVFTTIWIISRINIWICQKQIEWKREVVLLLMYINLAVILRFTFCWCPKWMHTFSYLYLILLRHFHSESIYQKRSPHKVRKTSASILVNNGILDISEVAQLLGHVSEQTLINHYLYSTKSSETRRERLEQSL